MASHGAPSAHYFNDSRQLATRDRASGHTSGKSALAGCSQAAGRTPSTDAARPQRRRITAFTCQREAVNKMTTENSSSASRGPSWRLACAERGTRRASVHSPPTRRAEKILLREEAGRHSSMCVITDAPRTFTEEQNTRVIRRRYSLLRHRGESLSTRRSSFIPSLLASAPKTMALRWASPLTTFASSSFRHRLAGFELAAPRRAVYCS